MKNFSHGLHFADPKNQSFLCDGCHWREAKGMLVHIISKLFPFSFQLLRQPFMISIKDHC
jgi:hypothetical protein